MLPPWLSARRVNARPSFEARAHAAVALVDGVCQGCHEQLSAVERDRLKRAEGPKRCEHCRRILII